MRPHKVRLSFENGPNDDDIQRVIVAAFLFAVFTTDKPSAPTVSTSKMSGSEEIVRISESPNAVERAQDALAMLAAHNAARAKAGLPPLAFDQRLCAIAREHAHDMVARSYFAHSTPEGVTPFARMSRLNYRFSYAGENIALDPSEAAASEDLLESVGHRENILQPHFTRVGISAYSSTDGEIFVEDFSD